MEHKLDALKNTYSKNELTKENLKAIIGGEKLPVIVKSTAYTSNSENSCDATSICTYCESK